jgi:hypothetical protein
MQVSWTRNLKGFILIILSLDGVIFSAVVTLNCRLLVFTDFWSGTFLIYFETETQSSPLRFQYIQHSVSCSAVAQREIGFTKSQLLVSI